ncbi:uncharacterized protein LOC132726472 isoform X2 [Ruditapes philippinarum]|uniref:uncharacterized protein LOC132726472 isoform X2 n=1 Tax=Ruditapes philippinarum TaxID=129788 RepID=UPI00295AD0A9|nr:uncharacterized protein LOC132726472 isoform X2 [Ruditapes philippinarum]
MSDRIFDDRKYAIFCKSVIDRETCSLYDQYFGNRNGRFGRPICDKNTGVLPRDIFCKAKGSREIYEGMRCAMYGHEENYNITRRDGSYIRELERISSSLLKLLSEARQKSLKEKASSDAWQRSPLHEDRPIPAVFPQEYRQKIINKQCTSHSGGDYARKMHIQQEQIPLRTTRLIAENDTSQMLISTSSVDSHETSEIQGKACRKEFKKSKTILPETSTRQKKTTHNLIEMRRRNFINNRIIELRNLLPDHIDRASCKKKGSILKESIEYIKQLRQDQERIKCLHDRICETEITISQLADKLEQLESQISNNNTTRNDDTDMMMSGASEQSENVKVYAEDDSVSGQESYSSPESPRSEIPQIEQVGHELNQIWVDLSTAVASDSTMSYPFCSEIDNGAMDYCQLA